MNAPLRATPLYHLLIEQARSRIKKVGWPMWKCDERSGLQAGYTAKLLHPESKNGRIARWETMALLFEALYPHGFDIVIQPHPAPLRDAEKTLVSTANQTEKEKTQQILATLKKNAFLAEIGRRGGISRTRRTTEEERKKWSRRGGKHKWLKIKEARAEKKKG